MPACYFLPGLLGTELYGTVGQGTESRPGTLIWANPAELAVGYFLYLTLDSAGIGPDTRVPTGLLPRKPLPKYYGETIQILTDELGAHGYSVIPWGYDWRHSILSKGALLAQNILGTIDASDPCSIVAHSQGGLVARAAWRLLVKAGHSNLVRRIVTIGTPHYGSYGPVAVFSLHDEILQQLSIVTVPQLLFNPLTPFGLTTALTTADVARVASTWPSFYELMPILGVASEDAVDPRRVALFTRANWNTPAKPAQRWLDHARDVYFPTMRDPDSIPPSWVLTQCSGTGIPTYESLVSPRDLGDIKALASVQDGDGRVTLAASAPFPGPKFQAQGGHSDTPSIFDNDGRLTAMVLDVRNPPPPPPAPPPPDPPPVVVPSTQVFGLSGPPYTGWVPNAPDC